jgi:soluble lytic murein transglycosylase-like protein
MNGITAIGRITSRIDQIQRSFGTPPRSAAAFKAALQDAATATAPEPTSDPSTEPKSSKVATAPPPPPEYVTLGGAPIVLTEPEPGVVEVRAVDESLLSEVDDVAAAQTLSGADIVGILESDWTAGLPERAEAFIPVIEEVAADTGLDPRLLAGLVWAESTFVPDAVSSAGAIGLAQLMPGTAAGLGVDPWDPAANVRGGAAYLSQQIDRFGSVELGLAAYNAGPGRVIEHSGAPSYTHAYIDRVLGYFEQLGGSR